MDVLVQQEIFVGVFRQAKELYTFALRNVPPMRNVEVVIHVIKEKPASTQVVEAAAAKRIPIVPLDKPAIHLQENVKVLVAQATLNALREKSAKIEAVSPRPAQATANVLEDMFVKVAAASLLHALRTVIVPLDKPVAKVFAKVKEIPESLVLQ